MYLIIGVILVAAGVGSWHPSPDASWPERVVRVVAEVVFWPKVFPEIVRRNGIV
jgi:hypothetical protein